MNSQPDADFLKKLTATFLLEARDHAQALGAGLLELERTPEASEQRTLVETLFREAHSLKGAARAVDAVEIERLCRTLEGAFGDVKAGQRALSAGLFDELHTAMAVLGQRIDALETGQSHAEHGMRSAEENAVPGGPETDRTDKSGVPPVALRVPGSTADTVRIATRKLDAIFVEAEELLGVKLAQGERALRIRALAALAAERDRFRVETLPLVRAARQQVEGAATAPGRGARARIAPMELPARLLALLEREREQAEAIDTGIADFARAMDDDRRRFNTLVDRLQEDVKKALMLPFATILAGFPKMARDLAREAGKEIEFGMRGGDIEIDKRILEKIKDPLTHLVRNSVDHGIETPAERARRGKPPCGVVTLAIARIGGKVEIQVADDGAGFDVSAVKAAAVKAGLITADESAALRDRDALELAFKSGVTTSRTVTAVSGLGLGMAIVRESAASLGGTAAIESTAGDGTLVHIMLPLTLATVRGTLICAANREFIVPTADVERVARVARESIKRVENRDSVWLDGTTLALVRLADALGLPSVRTPGDRAPSLTVLVLVHAGMRMAFAVDQVMGEQEVLAKPLGPLLPRVRNLAGATVFGTGRIVPILGVPDLLRTAAGCASTAGSGAPAETVRARRLLVVDDSITARTLLRNILESAGYEVKTVPDGAAAHAALRAEPFDLIVSDVEMPRMDGFELTRRIRAEPKLAELPVVLVTAREGNEDRERGVDAGANAYIVKSSFDQGNLLEAIERLM